MCLYPLDNKVNTAKKNIAVYKHVSYKGNEKAGNNIYRSGIIGFEYEENTLYKSNTFPTANIVKGELNGEGFHAYQDLTSVDADYLKYNSGRYIECYIPKGAKYILGKYSEVLCSSLVIGNILTKERYNKLIDDKRKAAAEATTV